MCPQGLRLEVRALWEFGAVFDQEVIALFSEMLGPVWQRVAP